MSNNWRTRFLEENIAVAATIRVKGLRFDLTRMCTKKNGGVLANKFNGTERDEPGDFFNFCRYDEVGTAIMEETEIVNASFLSSPNEKCVGSRRLLDLSGADRSTSLTVTSGLDLECFNDDGDRDGDSDNDDKEENNDESAGKQNEAKDREATVILTKKKGVRFGRVEFNEFRMCLGSNPSVTCGLPVELSWDFVGSSEMSVDEFDEAKQQRQIQRRRHGSQQLVEKHPKGLVKRPQLDKPPGGSSYSAVSVLSREERLKIANESHSFESVLKVYNEVQEIKRSRLESKVEDFKRAMAKEKREERKQLRAQRKELDNKIQQQQQQRDQLSSSSLTKDTRRKQRLFSCQCLFGRIQKA